MKEETKNTMLKVIQEFQKLEYDLTRFRSRSKRPTNSLRKALEELMGCEIPELD